MERRSNRGLRRSRVLAVLLAGALAAGACSSGDGDDDRDPLEDGETTTSVPVEAGAGDEEAIAAAEAYIDTLELDDAGRASLELVETRRGPGVTHVRFRQVFDGIPVRAARLIVNVADDGSVLGASSSLSDLRPEPGVEQQLDQAAATDVANKALTSEVDDTTSAVEVWLPDGDSLRLGWSVAMSTFEPSAGGGAPTRGSYVVWVDAVTGEVADARNTRLEHGSHAGAPGGGEACDLSDFDGPAACVFSPDPPTSAGGDVDVDDADDFRVPVELQGLDDESGERLVGEFVNLETEFDSNPPVVDDDGRWDQGQDDPGFEAAMAYFWIDTTQRLIQQVGFDDVRNSPMSVVAVEESEVFNAFFLNTVDGIFLGVDDGSTDIDAGEDADVIIHEYGHAVLHEQVPDFLFNEAAGGYHEAFGDVLAFLVTLGLPDEDPACLAPWFIGQFGPDGRCLRRMDGDKVFPQDLVNEVHLDGEIWTGAVFDIVEGLLAAEDLTVEDCSDSDACDEVRDRVLALSVGANEFMTGAETFPEVASAFLAANDAQFAGADAELLEAAFAAHGLDGGGAGTLDPNGDPTGELPPVAAAIDITHTFRGDLTVTVGVRDATFQPLCSDLVLLNENGQDGADNVSGFVDLSDTDCAQFVPPSPDQQWFLHAVDGLAEDVGQINGFAVIVEGEPFLATGVPAPIADNDPTGTAVIANGSGGRVPQEGEHEPGSGDAGVPFASIEIAHTFRGDLALRVGAVDTTTQEVLCSIPVLEPDPTDGDDDVVGDVDVSDCGQFFPPSDNVAWFLLAVDRAEVDTGTIERFELFGADGNRVGAAGGLPIDIPDIDPGGAFALILPQ